MNENIDEKPVREYEMVLGGVPFTIVVPKEPSKEAIKEFNKGVNKIAQKYLSKRSLYNE